jgi:hypothetical protein
MGSRLNLLLEAFDEEMAAHCTVHIGCILNILSKRYFIFLKLISFKIYGHDNISTLKHIDPKNMHIGIMRTYGPDPNV